jgi:hypothetical protein
MSEHSETDIVTAVLLDSVRLCDPAEHEFCGQYGHRRQCAYHRGLVDGVEAALTRHLTKIQQPTTTKEHN